MAFSEPVNITTDLTYTVKDLEACEDYIFAVGVRGDYGVGPLSNPQKVFTHFNLRAAPKGVTATASTKNHTTMVVSWNASCEHITTPIVYTVQK